jgi:uncharacterized membrane protein YdcZ (DUF606 family)
VFSHLSI